MSLLNFNKNLILGFLFLLLLSAPVVAEDGTVVGEEELGTLDSAAYRFENFLSSILGAFIGLLVFFLLAPYLIYKSEFQYAIKNFSKAVQKRATDVANGFVALYHKAVLKEKNVFSMVPKKNLLYYHYRKEQLVVTEKVVCGSEANKPNVEKISKAPDKVTTKVVRRNGRDVRQRIATPCWNARVSEWKVIESEKSTPEFTMGQNTISPNQDTRYMGSFQTKTKEFTKNGEKFRETVDYVVESNSSILAVGQANNGVMASGKPFIVSTKNYEATKAIIVKEQQGKELLFKIAGFLAFLFGMVLILSPIPALVDLGGAIPFIGDLFVGLAEISRTANFIVSIVVAIVMTVVLTVLMKILRFLTDNLIAIILVTILVGVAIMFLLGNIQL